MVSGTRYAQFASGVRALTAFVRAHPRRALAAVGAIAAVASCYPVVFLGKSFVSPAGVMAVYPSPPYWPGFPMDVVAEHFRGADVCALAWQFVPDTVVQSRSLLQDFEFPFWSRFVGGGLPLFAQGQSLIGDILHWIPVLLGGSAVGWDLTFVLSKAVFAAGMGLLVFRLTHHVGASVLIAWSSCFLGFFAYRFNHPAIFVLTYAPWVVLQWDRLGTELSLSCPRRARCLAQGLLLGAVTWLQLNAGPPKEGVITACFMHALGMLACVEQLRQRRGTARAVGIALAFGVALALASAPYWLLFLDALGKSFTSYDRPEVLTLPLWTLIGSFDNIFFQLVSGKLVAPSANIFVLLCLTAAVVSLRWRTSVHLVGTAALFVLALAIAYGIVPPPLLIRLPFINKIQHVYNAFSVPMMILALILAGFGIHRYVEASPPQKRAILIGASVAFLGMLAIYLSALVFWPISVKYSGSMWLIVPLAAVVFGAVWALDRQTISGVWDGRTLAILACCFVLLHVRHGMHPMTGIVSLDGVIQNPTERPDFSRRSTALDFVANRIRTRAAPVRVVGENEVLYPGVSSMVGLEGIVPVDALRNRYFEELLNAVDYPNRGDWLHLIRSDEVASRAAALDLLNIGYIVAMPGTPVPEGVTLVHSSDLDVWERPTVWPRAFFVNQTLDVRRPSDLAAALARAPGLPFGAVDAALFPDVAHQGPRDVPRVVPATDYSLTNNSTAFSVDAPGAGLIVLNETYYPEDFVARVNGKPVDYVRVNHAFKGVWVAQGGRYDVSFTYRPARWSQSILLSMCGVAALLALSVMTPGLPARGVPGVQ